MIKIVPILPKNLTSLQAATHQRALKRSLDQTALRAKKLLQDATKTWSSAPEVTIEEEQYARTITLKSAVFEFVDKGTKPHIIRAKQKRTARGRFGKRGLLAFRAAFRAKSSPGSLSSGPGGSSGPKVFAKVVRHPGTKARNYTGKIKAIVDVEFPRNFDTALSEEIG